MGLAGMKGRNGMGLEAERERGCRRGQKEISQLKKNPIEGEYPVVAARQQGQRLELVLQMRKNFINDCAVFDH